MRPNELSFSACARGHRRAIAALSCFASLLLAALLLASPHPVPESAGIDPRQALAELRRLGARRSFLTDSPDVYLEPKSLHRFFTERIYSKLQGNAYFGYEYDEGFLLAGNQVHLEVLKDFSRGACCQNAYRIALEQALQGQGLVINPRAPHQIGVSIVGVERQETPNTLPGVMVEGYLRNSVLKKSFFIRYGAGHPRGLAAAIRLSAEMLAAQIISRAEASQHSGRVAAAFKAPVGRQK